MTEQEILETCTELLRDLLGDDSIVLSMDTKREDVAHWDSLNYINFIAIAEMKFGVTFKVADVESFATVGSIVAQIKKMMR